MIQEEKSDSSKSFLFQPQVIDSFCCERPIYMDGNT